MEQFFTSQGRTEGGSKKFLGSILSCAVFYNLNQGDTGSKKGEKEAEGSSQSAPDF